MLPKATIIVLIQYAVQAVLALIVMLLLNRFYKNYQNKYFQYWSWSWLGLMIYLVGSAVTLIAVFTFEFNHPFRTISSILTLAAGLFQSTWLLIGSYELSNQKELGKRPAILVTFFLAFVSLVFVIPYMNNPDAIAERLFLRVGIRSFISGTVFMLSSYLIWRLRNSGIGIRFIILAFLLYGLEQYNYFLTFLAPLLGQKHLLSMPYYFGIVDFLLQTIMGIGMIISVLELEQVNLRKANNELDTFLYRASHDLRAPLTTILGLVSAIKTEKNTKTTEGYVGLIENRIHLADKVIKDIITLRKGQKVELNIRKIDLDKLIKSSFEMLKTPELNIQLCYESTINQMLTDEGHLKTVINNLLSNAIKYRNPHQPDPHIKVTVSEGSLDQIIITIQDNGSGIDQKFIPKIFDMFYRANEKSNGSGLGLYLAKDALGHIGGKIEVTSEVGKGTTFIVSVKNWEK